MGWSQCAVTCGRSTVARTRECVGERDGEPAIGCDGRASESKVCFADQAECPTWNSWGNWGSCSATCKIDDVSVAVPASTRSRTCQNGTPGDIGCEGSDKEVDECDDLDICPSWSLWAS